ncbi:S-adenosyl-L-methionine dependent methyltransferase [Klebsiella pneumoniae subsp. rhinoscleromatis]|nr:S-adenosyl-L-methionine dependent methyltransferase [Klebsiella pneumoniae subsp. rhinoscleromatis]
MTDPVFALEPDVPRNVRLARWLLFRLLSGLREGSLTVREGAQTFHFGDPAAALRAEVRVCTPEVYWRLLTGGSLAAAEAWMDGDWESHQLTTLLQILARNGEVLGRLERGFRLLGKARRPPAPLDPPQHPRPGAGEHRRPLRPRQRILCPFSG